MLTRKQYDLLMFIHTRVQREGISPSFDEMKEALNLRSKSGIHRLVTALEERGYIRRMAHRARAVEVIRLPENVSDTIDLSSRRFRYGESGGERFARLVDRAAYQPGTSDVPLIGRIAAGIPIEAMQQNGQMVGVPAAMLNAGGEHFALEVRGDSMVDAGIHEGDIVVVRRQDMAANGDIIVALIEDHEATLKRLRQRGTSVALEAANEAYETRVYRVDQVRIQGRMVGLIRTC